MALSRTLEPDPGHAGVGTEKGRQRQVRLFIAFSWISVMFRLEIDR
jgi:hypothetical protein